jgi:sugar lactone lactonase YvrE
MKYLLLLIFTFMIKTSALAVPTQWESTNLLNDSVVKDSSGVWKLKANTNGDLFALVNWNKNRVSIHRRLKSEGVWKQVDVFESEMAFPGGLSISGNKVFVSFFDSKRSYARRSEDNGTTWKTVFEIPSRDDSNASRTYSRDIVVAPSGLAVLAVSTYESDSNGNGLVFRSNNFGETWELGDFLDGTGAPISVNGIAISPNEETILTAGWWYTPNYFLRWASRLSTDKGVSWSLNNVFDVNEPLGGAGDNYSISAAPNGSFFSVGSYSNLLHSDNWGCVVRRADDQGSNWKTVLNIQNDSVYNCRIMTSSTSKSATILGGDRMVESEGPLSKPQPLGFYSENYGNSWSALSLPENLRGNEGASTPAALSLDSGEVYFGGWHTQKEEGRDRTAEVWLVK